jgi:hypothetical protein
MFVDDTTGRMGSKFALEELLRLEGSMRTEFRLVLPVWVNNYQSP